MKVQERRVSNSPILLADYRSLFADKGEICTVTTKRSGFPIKWDKRVFVKFQVVKNFLMAFEIGKYLWSLMCTIQTRT